MVSCKKQMTVPTPIEYLTSNTMLNSSLRWKSVRRTSKLTLDDEGLVGFAKMIDSAILENEEGVSSLRTQDVCFQIYQEIVVPCDRSNFPLLDDIVRILGIGDCPAELHALDY
ncbi:hypothetical protein QE152_g10365 [Popillia japonica]|uniref:Uncharacterized protein n=1 Tax=Popillia japonica TaxID=7064 RepID=A0AAW1LVR0_POPJA